MITNTITLRYFTAFIYINDSSIKSLFNARFNSSSIEFVSGGNQAKATLQGTKITADEMPAMAAIIRKNLIVFDLSFMINIHFEYECFYIKEING